MKLQPSGYPSCKHYREDLLELLKDLEIYHIFTHSDEQVHARRCQTIWKESTQYQTAILLMGSFHQLKVRQKTIFKRHNIMSYRVWLTDTGGSWCQVY